jgi:hypothetical protein
MLARAMRTAVELSITDFHAMPNDLTSTMCTFGGERMDGAFETIEHMPLSAKHHLKRLVIFVSTDFALSHCSSFLLRFHPCEGLRPFGAAFARIKEIGSDFAKLLTKAKIGCYLMI